MWDDRVNKYLDNEDDINNADENIKAMFVYYKRIIHVMDLRTDYRPSRSSKEQFLRKVRRANMNRKVKVWAFALGAAAAAVLIIVLSLGGFGLFHGGNTNISPASSVAVNEDLSQLKDMVNINDDVVKSFEQTADTLQILQIVSDGF